MIYSYTQISQYLRCPRSYRYRYLDGWREKDTRAALVFGRCFEKALGAYFRTTRTARQRCSRNGEPSAMLRLSTGKESLGIGCCIKGFTCSRSSHEMIAFAFRNPKRTCSSRSLQTLAGGNEFVSYIDAIGELDGKRCLIDWKTTTSRYPEEPEGLLSLDPQLVCYSWISGISDVAIVVFVRKQRPGDPIPEGHDHRRAAEGVWPAGRSDRRSDRNGPVLLPQRNPFPAERLRQLRSPRSVPWQPATRSKPTSSVKPGASDLDWLDVLDD